MLKNAESQSLLVLFMEKISAMKSKRLNRLCRIGFSFLAHMNRQRGVTGYRGISYD